MGSGRSGAGAREGKVRYLSDKPPKGGLDWALNLLQSLQVGSTSLLNQRRPPGQSARCTRAQHVSQPHLQVPPQPVLAPASQASSSPITASRLLPLLLLASPASGPAMRALPVCCLVSFLGPPLPSTGSLWISCQKVRRSPPCWEHRSGWALSEGEQGSPPQ